MSDTSLKWTEEALQKLEKIPSFVRPMAKGKIEKAAQEAGHDKVTAEFIDQIKGRLMG